MKAMIFAAGLGTRLKPLTDRIPKALVPIAGKPLLEHVIEKLKWAGFNEIIINVHHFPEQIIQFLKQNDNFGIRIEISDESSELLETGGGIKKAAHFFDDGKPFLIHNVDILSNVDIKAFYQSHITANASASLLVSKRDTSRYLLFDNKHKLQGWINESTGETKPEYKVIEPKHYNKYAFSGLHIMSPSIFEEMDKWEGKFSIIDFYLKSIESQDIMAYYIENLKMIDVGKLNSLEQAEELIKELN